MKHKFLVSYWKRSQVYNDIVYSDKPLAEFKISKFQAERDCGIIIAITQMY